MLAGRVRRPGVEGRLGQPRSRAVRVVSVETSKPSPMAQSLLFNWIAAHMYEGDAPLAERRAAALALDRFLADLLGAELRELLDPGVLADVELDVQHLSDGRRRAPPTSCTTCCVAGDLTATEVELRSEPAGGRPPNSCWRRWSPSAGRSRCRSPTSSASSPRRTLHGIAMRCALPLGLPQAFTDPVLRPLEELVARYKRERTGRSSSATPPRASGCRSRAPSAHWLPSSSTVEPRGEFRPDGVRREWCT